MATPTSMVDEQLNLFFASQFGFTVQQVKFLRDQFKQFGRNPLPSNLEILALENGFDEEKVKALCDMHLAHLRKSDGFSGAPNMNTITGFY